MAPDVVDGQETCPQILSLIREGVFGPEYALQFTFVDFDKKIAARLDDIAADHVTKMHDLLGMCFQGEAVIKWIAVLDQSPVANRTLATFKESQQLYLEKRGAHGHDNHNI